MQTERANFTIEALVAVQGSAIERVEKHVFGNGQPGLESKLSARIGEVRGELKQYIESVERHGDNNMREGDGLLLNELKEERIAREHQHSENTARQDKIEKKVDRLMILNATLTGALLAVKFFEDFGLIHIGGTH